MAKQKAIKIGAVAICAVFFLQQSFPAFSGEVECRKRLMYDYCMGVMIRLAAELTKEEGGAAVFDQAMERFHSVWDEAGYSALPEHPEAGVATGAGIQDGYEGSAFACLGTGDAVEAGIRQIAERVDPFCKAS